MRDLQEWVQRQAPAKAKVYVVCIALHCGGRYYADKCIREEIAASGKNIALFWTSAMTLEDRKTYSAASDVLRPTHIPNDPAVQAYVATLQRPPMLRNAGNPGEADLFSCDQGKILLEQEFLKTGVHIRQICPNLPRNHRPLGYIILESLGFGSLFVTYRNCPNNAPLALWVDKPWYPLFPRTTNAEAAIARDFAPIEPGDYFR